MLPAVFADLATEEKIKPKPMELREVKTIIGTVRWSGPKKRETREISPDVCGSAVIFKFRVCEIVFSLLV